MRKASALALLIALAIPFTAERAEAQIAQGLNEMNASASFTSTEGSTAFNISGFFGHFLTPNIEIGPRINYFKSEGVSGRGSVGAFGSYHFGAPGATTVPFAGALVDIGVGSGSSSASFGGFGGAKFFLNEGAALTAQGFVTFGDFTTIGAQGGVSIFF